ncbi:FTR1 family protein [Brevibacterium casei]|uniref:iron uptake transporter permease EfeU n=2 Tax=Bacteria TaxID=2 RepID=UPI001CE56268|nr:iron uptake transporter permease EfeU [Brevibacterium casei]MCT2182996.1 FTR1 family protein [Brevibacterium casei]QZE27054.1 FTR1 family protein [Brevibacterium casei]
MFQTFLIGLREGLEAALIVSILIGYLGRIGRTREIRAMWWGIAAAIVVSLGFGALLTFGPSTLTFEAQEFIGGTLSIIAVGFVTWMIFWMARTAKGLAGELRTAADRALDGPLIGLVVLGAFSVGREGLETALFLWAATRANASAGASALGLTLAAVAGILIAVVLAWLIAKGLLRLNLSKFFRYSGAFLIIVAAGVLAYGFHDLQEAGIIPGLHSLAFDVSGVIPPTSWYGVLLKGIFNFSPATTWVEFTVWWLYVLIVGTLFVRGLRSSPKPATASAPVSGTATA